MRTRALKFTVVLAVATVLTLVLGGATQAQPRGPEKELSYSTSVNARSTPDLARQPTLYVVVCPHLDTEWCWEYPQTIKEYLPKTMRNNFALFKKYPHYILNFSGTNRYMMMKEYYPSDSAKLKHYVALGRWFPAGSSMKENDVNSPSAESAPTSSELHVSDSSLENSRYRTRIDENGDVSSIFDKKLDRELLSSPIRLVILTDNPQHYPAWNMDFNDEQRPPRTVVSGPATVRIAEKGPSRVALPVTREAEHSKLMQRIRLAAGDTGNRVEFADSINWMTREANLKVQSPAGRYNRLYLLAASYDGDQKAVVRVGEKQVPLTIEDGAASSVPLQFHKVL